MEIRLPKTVTIGGVKVAVRWRKNLPGGDWGGYDHDSHLIVLSREHCVTQELAANTLLHEMNHAALAIGGVSYVLSGKAEEAVVRNFDDILLPAIRRVLSSLG